MKTEEFKQMQVEALTRSLDEVRSKCNTVLEMALKATVDAYFESESMAIQFSFGSKRRIQRLEAGGSHISMKLLATAKRVLENNEWVTRVERVSLTELLLDGEVSDVDVEVENRLVEYIKNKYNE